MPTCSKTQPFDIQRVGSLSWIHNQSGVGIHDGVRVWVFTCFKCRRVCEWELLRGSQRWENREDAEASQRLTVSRAKLKPASMQRFKCCPVEFYWLHLSALVNTKFTKKKSPVSQAADFFVDNSFMFFWLWSIFGFHVQMLRYRIKGSTCDLFNTSAIRINLAGVIGGYRRDGLAMAVLQGWVWGGGSLHLCLCSGGGVNLLVTAVVNGFHQ